MTIWTYRHRLQRQKTPINDIKLGKVRTIASLKYTPSKLASIPEPFQQHHRLRMSTIKNTLVNTYDVPETERETFWKVASEIVRFTDFEGGSYVIKFPTPYNAFIKDVFFLCGENSRESVTCKRFIEKLITLKSIKTISIGTVKNETTGEQLIKDSRHLVQDWVKGLVQTSVKQFYPTFQDLRNSY